MYVKLVIAMFDNFNLRYEILFLKNKTFIKKFNLGQINATLSYFVFYIHFIDVCMQIHFCQKKKFYTALICTGHAERGRNSTVLYKQ